MEGMIYSGSMPTGTGALTAAALCLWTLPLPSVASDNGGHIDPPRHEVPSSPKAQINFTDGSTVRSAKQTIVSAIQSLAGLRLNWDGRGGLAPSESTIQEAIAFLDEMPPWASMPSVEPSGDGEINLVWKSGARYVEVGFDGVGEASYLEAVGDDLTYDAFAARGKLPGGVINALSRVSNAVLYM